MLEEIKEKSKEAGLILTPRGYKYERLEPKEFFNHMTGENPSGNTITL